MKRFIALIVLILLIGLGFFYKKDLVTIWNRWVNFSFCDASVSYKLSSIDPKFNIPRERVEKSTKEAGKLWNDLVGRDLFIYDANSDLEISLVFDERQGSIAIISEAREDIETTKENLELSVREFEQKKQQLEEDLNQLNDEINYWNKRGGAPKDKYNELISRQQELSREIQNINSMADKLNIQTQKINQKVDQVNKEVEKFNNLLSVKPEEGLYMAGTNKIEVYIYENDQSYTHTVAHELGHALGLDHVKQEHSIMYPVSSPQSKATQADLELITAFCQQQNRLDLIRNDLKNFFYILVAEIDNVVT